jgi:hypothetical protein
VSVPSSWGQFCRDTAVKVPIFVIFTARLAEFLQKKPFFSAEKEVCGCKPELIGLETA